LRSGVGFQPAGNPTNGRIKMLLEGKNAVIYGGGKVGGAVAFMASDRPGTTTGTVFNLTSATVVD
jgi:hypothetical protein